jgi:hypothetical protein
MSGDAPKETPNSTDEGWPIFEVWEKYEKIAMHFNDLIIKLRIQALAGVTALFAKSDAASNGVWGIAALLFGGLCLAWIAIWIIDFSYYNRLLTGAVISILKLEEQSKTSTRVRHIDISSSIEAAVANEHTRPKPWRYVKLSFGRWAFYVIVFFALGSGFVYSMREHSSLRLAPNSPVGLQQHIPNVAR